MGDKAPVSVFVASGASLSSGGEREKLGVEERSVVTMAGMSGLLSGWVMFGGVVVVGRGRKRERGVESRGDGEHERLKERDFIQPLASIDCSTSTASHWA